MLFPYLFSLAKVRSQIHLTNVCLVTVTAFPRLVYSTTRRTPRASHSSDCQAYTSRGNATTSLHLISSEH